MGLWWKRVWVEVPKQVLQFAGDPSAVSKSWPILWRYGQDRHCLQIVGKYELGYRLYFSTETRIMSFRNQLVSRFVSVMEGPEPVVFWAIDDNGVKLEILKTGRMLPASRFRPDRSLPNASSFEYLRAIGEVTHV